MPVHLHSLQNSASTLNAFWLCADSVRATHLSLLHLRFHHSSADFDAVNGTPSLKHLFVGIHTHVRPEDRKPSSLGSLENDHDAVKLSISGKSNIHMLLNVMDILEGSPGGNLPTGFRALYDTFNCIVSGEQKNALNLPFLGKLVQFCIAPT